MRSTQAVEMQTTTLVVEPVDQSGRRWVQAQIASAEWNPCCALRPRRHALWHEVQDLRPVHKDGAADRRDHEAAGESAGLAGGNRHATEIALSALPGIHIINLAVAPCSLTIGRMWPREPRRKRQPQT